MLRGHVAVIGVALVARVGAAAARARSRASPARSRSRASRAAAQRPDLRHALGDAAVARGVLARHRAGGVPRRPAALAARARRARRAVPRARHAARRRAEPPWAGARRPGPDGRLLAAGVPVLRRRPRAAGDAAGAGRRADRRAGRARRQPRRHARPRRVARRRPRAARGRAAPRSGIALENAQLHVESQARLAELRASRERIVAAGDAERRRLERDLHDGAQQRLVAIALQLRLLRNRVARRPVGPGARHDRERGAQPLARRAARARARDPPRRARARPRRRARVARDAGDGRDVGHLRAGRPPARAGRARRVLRRLRGARERREVRARDAAPACASGARAALATIEIADDGIGGADDSARLRACAASPTASRRSTAASRVTSPPGGGTTVVAELPCAS